jgi:hypothetical protein
MQEESVADWMWGMFTDIPLVFVFYFLYNKLNIKVYWTILLLILYELEFCHSKGSTKAEGVRELVAEEDVWA